MAKPLRTIATMLATAALLVGCTIGQPEPEPEPVVPFMVADQPEWGLYEAQLNPVVFAQGRPG